MKLSKMMQKNLIDEINFACDGMESSDSPFVKMYFFSAAFGAVHRIMNIEFDPELAFVHEVLRRAYEQVNGRLTIAAQGREELGLPDKLFSRLEDELRGLAKQIEDGQRTYPVLERISNLAYSSTGNGYYLYLRGVLPV